MFSLLEVGFDVGKSQNYTMSGGFKYFVFAPGKLGKISSVTHVFQLGGNHQPV